MLLRLATTTKKPIAAISYSKDGKPCTGDGSGRSADMAALTSVIITAVAAAAIITISPIVVMIFSYHLIESAGSASKATAAKRTSLIDVCTLTK
jgi:hypothetical protein